MGIDVRVPGLHDAPGRHHDIRASLREHRGDERGDIRGARLERAGLLRHGLRFTVRERCWMSFMFQLPTQLDVETVLKCNERVEVGSGELESLWE